MFACSHRACSRLITDDERKWTEDMVDTVANKHFPNLTRDALKRPILYSNWLTKDYMPVDREELRQYVKARLKVFYEEELDVPLVLFNEVLDHVLRIDRIFRQPQVRSYNFDSNLKLLLRDMFY